MKLLCVVEDFPWPARAGAHLRSQQVIATLAALGELDLFSLVYPKRPDPCHLPADIPARLRVFVAAPPVYTVRTRLRWLASRSLPLEVVANENADLRAAFHQWVDSSYDLIWVNRAGTFEMLGRPQLGRTVVDLVDLEDQKIRTRLDVMRAQPPDGGLPGRVHRQAAVLQARSNAARWSRFQADVARSVDTVVVCSLDDLEMVALPNAVLVPNGYEAPPDPLDHTHSG